MKKRGDDLGFFVYASLFSGISYLKIEPIKFVSDMLTKVIAR
ncbi:hypothetical protein [Olivibacter sp. LS-1]|nr:hypothetical protein [Olivibacter sp. LS-1]